MYLRNEIKQNMNNNKYDTEAGKKNMTNDTCIYK